MRTRGAAGQEGVDRDAAMWGFHRIQVEGYEQRRWSIACTDCETTSHHGWQMNTSPALMVKNMRNAGWDVDRKKAVCPACQKAEKEKNVVKQHIGPDPKIARKIYALLDEHFDEVRRLYRDGWTDSKIAAEIDTSVDIVIRLRRDAYAELAEHPAYQEIRAELAAHRQEAEGLKTLFMLELNAVMEKVAGTEQRLAEASGIYKKAAG